MVVASPPWPPDVALSVYDGGGRPVSPERAYRGMPDDVAVTAAVVDSLIWDAPEWVGDVNAWREAEPPPAHLLDLDRLLAKHGWRDAQDILDAAGVTIAQSRALALHLLRWDNRAIGEEMGIAAHAAQMQVLRALDKLHKLVGCDAHLVKGEGEVSRVCGSILSDRQMRSRREREIPSGLLEGLVSDGVHVVIR